MTATASRSNLPLQLARPLLDEMGRAQDRETIRLAAIDQLAQDQAGLDRLADADIVRDQQAHDGKAQRHQQRHELIGTRFEAQPRRRAERSCAAPEREPQRLGQQARTVLGRDFARRRHREPRRTHRLAFERRVNDLHIGLGAGERTQAERVLIRRRQRHPFASARKDEIARRKHRGHAG